MNSYPEGNTSLATDSEHRSLVKIVDLLNGSVSSGGAVLSGIGAPDDSLGNNGNIYINIANGAIYTKSGDTWSLFVSGSGTNPLMHGAGVPDNVTNAPADPALTWLWHDDDTGNVFWWLANSGEWTA